MKILCLFYPASAGVGIANSLILSGIEYWKTSTKSNAVIEVFASNDSRSLLFDQKIAEFAPDVIVTQDTFPGIIEAMNNSEKTKNLCFSLPPIDHASYKDYSNIQYLEVVQDNEGDKGFYVPFDITALTNSRPWLEREEICYIGRFNEHKFSETLATGDLEIHAFTDIKTAGSEKLKSLVTSNKNIKVNPVLDRVMVPRALNKYKYHILHTKTDCFSLISAEAMMCGCIPIIIGNENWAVSTWTGWMPEGFGFRLETWEDFLKEKDNIFGKDHSRKAYLESNWMRSFHNKPNFAYQFDNLLKS